MRKMTEERREAILDAAAQEFAEKGYAGSSIAAIATRIGGSKPTIYRYFSSKEELFAEVTNQAIQKLMKGAYEDIPVGDDFEAALRRHGEHYLSVRQSPEMISLTHLIFGDSGRSEIGRLLWERGKMRFLKRVGAGLSKAMKAGKLRAADPLVATFHLFGLLEAELIEQVVFHVRKPASVKEIARIAERAIDAFVAAYRP